MSQEQRDRIAHLLQLAEELGARSVNLPGRLVAETILEYARRHNVTKVIARQTIAPTLGGDARGSVVNQLIRHSGPIDIYVVSSDIEPSAEVIPQGWRPHRPLLRYLWGVALVIGATGISALIAPFISPTNLVVIYLFSVVRAAVYLGAGRLS